MLNAPENEISTTFASGPTFRSKKALSPKIWIKGDYTYESFKATIEDITNE
jgi:hypothetical protein